MQGGCEKCRVLEQHLVVLAERLDAAIAELRAAKPAPPIVSDPDFAPPFDGTYPLPAERVVRLPEGGSGV